MRKLLVILTIFMLSVGSVNAGFFSSIFDFFTGDDNVENKAKQAYEDTSLQNTGNSIPQNSISSNNSGMDNFKLLGDKVKEKQDLAIRETTIIPLDIGTIFGFSIDTKIRNIQNGSLVRFVLTDGVNMYQVYESYPRLHGKGLISVNNICEETCALEGFVPTQLIVEIINAEVEVDGFYYLNNENELTKNVGDINTYRNQIKKSQNKNKIEALQNNEWIAGETSISNLTYAEKKRLIGISGNSFLNLQGFEYYKGGVFTMPSIIDSTTSVSTSTPTSSSYPSSWDWRNRHGENWHTSIKNQGSCGSCAIFAATGATEHLVNIYYNQHLDLNLAEQDGVSCGGGSCQGAFPYKILDYYTSTGVVDENAFPYKAIDASGCSYSSCTYTPVTCDQKSSTPTEKVKISGRDAYSYTMGEDVLKKMIIDGAVSGGLRSMSHAMAMSGWKTDTDGATIWIFKNSWGSGWGEAGYANMKVDISDFAWTHSLNPEITSTMGDYDIACVDKDGDNYCNWGIGAEKPASCPSTCHALKDCDDSKSNLGPFDSSYNCIALEGCSDTDNGLNYDMLGTITGSTTGTDSCVDSTSLKEYYCTINNTGAHEIHECSFMCIDGACVEPTCSDTDGGLSYDILGSISGTVTGTDSCLDSTILKEYYCTADNNGVYEIHNCSSMCIDGACVEPTCSDSDNGINYNTYGYITGYMAFDDENRDVCLDDKTLQEVYCSDNLGYVKEYTCPDICQNGQCVEAIYPTVSITYPTNNASLADKFLIIEADATDTVSVEFYINGNFISSDSSAPFASNKVNTRSYSGTNTITAIATSLSGIQATDISIFTIDSGEEEEEDPTPVNAECNDGKDNDGDKTCDYNGCAKNRNIWYPADPDCIGPEDTSESN